MDRGKPRWPRAYSFVLVTAAFFLLSWAGQFLAQLVVAGNEAARRGQALEWADFLAQFTASTLENWQSEFLQLIWQTLGLLLFLCWGSSQSREGDARLEAKTDALLRAQGLDPDAISEQVNRSM